MASGGLASASLRLGGLPPLVTSLEHKGDLLTHDGTTEQALPVGDDGQVLSADSSAPDGVAWIDPPAGGAGGVDVDATFTAKGDLVTRTDADVAILPVGEDGDVLFADSSQPTGLGWKKGTARPDFVLGCDIDLRTLDAQAIAADGDFTLSDGHTFTAINRANADTFALEAGTGLHIKCKASMSVSSNASARTSPAAYLPLRRLSTALGNLTGMPAAEIWVWIKFAQAHMPNADSQGSYLGIISEPVSGYTPALIDQFDSFRGYNSGNGGTLHIRNGRMEAIRRGQANSMGSSYADTEEMYDVYAFRLTQEAIGLWYGQSVGGNFPDIGSMLFSARYNLGTGAHAYDTDSKVWAAFVSIYDTTTAGTQDVILERLKVEFR